MGNPQPSPEMRTCFEADAQSTLQKIQETLPALDCPAPEFAQIQPLSDSLHSLRGAASLVGGRALSAFLTDLERLLEIAASFQFGAVDRARLIFQLIHQVLPCLPEILHHTLSDQPAQAENCQRAAHQRILQEWGDYFYGTDPSPEVDPPTLTADPPDPVGAAMARQFLESLGLDPAQPPAPSDPLPESAGVMNLGTLPEWPSPLASPWPPQPSQDNPAPSPEPQETSASLGEPTSAPAHPYDPSPPDPTAVAADFLQGLGFDSAPPPPPTPCEVTPLPSQLSPAHALVADLHQPTSREAVAPCLAAASDRPDPDGLACFVQEMEECLEQLDERLLAWDREPNDKDIVYAVYRLIHTLKGTAHTVGVSAVGSLLHDLEDILERIVAGQSPTDTKSFVFLLYEVSGLLRTLVAEGQVASPSPAAQAALQNLARNIARHKERPESEVEPTTPAPEITTPEAAPSQTPAPTEATESSVIRVDSHCLDLLLNLVGEVVIARTRLEHKLTDISHLRQKLLLSRSRLLKTSAEFEKRFEPTRRDAQDCSGTPSRIVPLLKPYSAQSPTQSRPETSAAAFSPSQDDFAPLVQALVEISAETGEMIGQLTRLFDLFGAESGRFSKITARLQEEILRARMVPVAGLFRRLQRVAREAATKEGKEIDFQAQGGDIRLDKAILDQLYRPLLHLVRNAVAHGIESPEQRRLQSKPTAGLVRLRAFHEFNQAGVEITDDGHGLDYESIRTEAIRRGLIANGTSSETDDLTKLIFEPGFSTARRASDVSGRGVGLDVVRQEIARLNGTIHVFSEPGVGCTFVIRLPLTLSINRAMLVRAGGETLALPLNFVDRILDVSSTRLTRSGLAEYATVEGQTLPLIRLPQRLGLPAGADADSALVLARVGDRSLVLLVDRVLQKQDIVVKPLGPFLAGHKLFCGATVSGDGRVVLIANIPGLLESALPPAAAGMQPSPNPQLACPD